MMKDALTKTLTTLVSVVMKKGFTYFAVKAGCFLHGVLEHIHNLFTCLQIHSLI